MLLSEAELELIETGSKNLNMQDLGLFWQLTLKTIDDLKSVSNENIALEMFLMQLMHAKNIDEHNNNEERNLNYEKLSGVNSTPDETEKRDLEVKQSNFSRDQMKSTVQAKTVEKKDVVTKTNFQINSFSDLIASLLCITI